MVADISFACPACTRGSGYNAGQVNNAGSPVIFSAPDIPGGAQATGRIGSRIGTGIATVLITNQGSGYTKAPTVTFPAPAGGGTTAVGVAIMGDIILGNPTPPLAGAFGCVPSVPTVSRARMDG